MAEKTIVMVSSTAIDLPEHRGHVKEACLRVGMFPKMMEHLPPVDADAIETSMAMVDKADVYVGIFAHRYGYVPKGRRNSITQMEYERACKRKIPRLIFLMHKDHPIKVDDIESGPGAKRLEKLKGRLKKELVVNFFKSPEELQGQVIHALAEEKIRRLEAQGPADAVEVARALHPSVDIPAAPEPYIAHPFTLLRTRTGLIGRREELDLLTDWIARPETVGHARVFSLVAIGGQGKSALSWHWFNQIAPKELTGQHTVEGRVWWSFYESDATYENFVVRTLAYVTGRPAEELRKEPLSDCEITLLHELGRRPFLLVLDGLERILIAYAGMEAAHIQDEDVTEAEQDRRLRQTIDPRAGRFLRALTAVRASHVLITTRLFPTVLEGPTDGPIHGVHRCDLSGLSDDDALALWRSFEVSGTRDAMLRLFRTFDSHPLLIQALAAKVARDREHPRDFDAWQAANPQFDPFSLPLTQVKSHILATAMAGLSDQELYVLHVIAAFRMPAGYDTLCALLIGDEPRQCADQAALIAAFSDLEDRGLLGWDNRPGVNRYDLHPIVRGVTWSGVPDDARQAIYGTLEVHFQAMPMVDVDDVNSLEDLTPAIELYDKLIGLQRYDDAYLILEARLQEPLRDRLAANRLYLELATALFPDGLEKAPRIGQDPCCLFQQLSYAIAELGDLKGALSFHIRHNQSCVSMTCPLNESTMLADMGRIYEAELTVARVFQRIQEERCDNSSLVATVAHMADIAFKRRADGMWSRMAREICKYYNRKTHFGVRETSLAIDVLIDWEEYADNRSRARDLAEELWRIARNTKEPSWMIGAAIRQGDVAILANRSDEAYERFNFALTKARGAGTVGSEVAILVKLAKLHRRRGEPDAARELLEDVWGLAERGPYPMFHADGLNVLAQIERDAGNESAAVAAATRAFELAWCDGPPFAYHWGLEAARKHLGELGAAEPVLPEFDESKFEPMPEVEINPDDEFAGL